MFVSYAQNFEDVMLWRALKHVEKGFYIDIGAQDPVVDSVSLAFYEQGWRGVHVEPSSFYADKLRLARPDETVIQAAVGSKSGVLSFYEIDGTGLSTGDVQIAEKHRGAGFTTKETVVSCLPLADILERYRDRQIHWLKIDVEGMESEVIRGWSSSEVRPWIIVVESTLPNTQVETHGEWEPLLFEHGYEFVYFDGLNRFYISEYHQELREHFRYPPNFFDFFTLSGEASASFCLLLKNKLGQREQEFNVQKKHLMNTLAEREQEINELQAHAERINNDWNEVTRCLDTANKRIHELELSITQQETVFKEANRELQAIYTSWSWRLTKPLRLVNKHIKSVPGVIKAMLLYVIYLPRRLARRLLEIGLAYVRRHSRNKDRFERLFARWPRLHARLHAFAAARSPQQVTIPSYPFDNAHDSKFDLNTYSVSTRIVYHQLLEARSRRGVKNKEGKDV